MYDIKPYNTLLFPSKIKIAPALPCGIFLQPIILDYFRQLSFMLFFSLFSPQCLSPSLMKNLK